MILNTYKNQGAWEVRGGEWASTHFIFQNGGWRVQPPNSVLTKFVIYPALTIYTIKLLILMWQQYALRMHQK